MSAGVTVAGTVMHFPEKINGWYTL